MTVAAMWCRHAGDNLIGIGREIPWHIESDSRHFLDVVAGQTVVCGRETYESFPGRTIDGCKIYVMTSNPEYEVVDTKNHTVLQSQKSLADLEEDLYIAGGATVYELFLTGKECLKPHIIIDCVYGGDVRSLAGRRVDISNSVAIMEKKYRQITPHYCQDGVESAVWVKKGEFVEQSVLKRIIGILERGAELRW